MAAKHTPGPWKILPDMVTVEGSNGATVVDLSNAMGGDDTAADARLIAAAPDLLAALEATVAQLDLSATMRARATNEPASVCYAVEMARAALAKARQ